MAAPSLDEVLASPTSALLVGMGVANRAVAGALARRGHTVVAVDDNPSDELRADADALGITLGRATNSPILSPLQHSSSRPPVSRSSTRRSPSPTPPVWRSCPSLISQRSGTIGRSSPSPAPTARRRRSSSPSPRSQPMVVSPSPPGTPTSRLSRRSTIPTLTSSCRGVVVSTCRASRFRPTVATWLNFARSSRRAPQPRKL